MFHVFHAPECSFTSLDFMKSARHHRSVAVRFFNVVAAWNAMQFWLKLLNVGIVVVMIEGGERVSYSERNTFRTPADLLSRSPTGRWGR